MNFSALFIRRPVATFLLAHRRCCSPARVAYRFLPVAALPSVDIPTVVVFASRPGADPETMATSIAAPLERRLGEIAGVTEITSISAIGATSIIVQFDIGRDIDGAAHDVQAAINAATPDLPIRPADPAVFPQVQPGRNADHDHRADLRHAVAGAGLRRRRQHPRPAPVAGGRAWRRCR